MVKSNKSQKEIALSAKQMEAENLSDANAEEQEHSKLQKKKKQRKDSELAVSNDEDESVPEIAKSMKQKKSKKLARATSVDTNTAESAEDDDDQAELVKSSKAQKNSKKSAFELLMDDDDDDDDVPANNVEDEDEEEEEQLVVPKKQAAGKKSKKAKRKEKQAADDNDDADDDLAEQPKGKKLEESTVEAEEAGTVKSAAQKKREKKERQKREAALAKQKSAQQPLEPLSETSAPVAAVVEPAESVNIEEDEETGKAPSKHKKKNKKDKKAQEEEEAAKNSKKKGISSSMMAAMQERLKQIKEEEERLQRAEEERIRLAEEREEQRLEAIRLEAERKEKKKQKEAERKARLKAEGKLLTKKQKEERARAQAMLEALKAQGLELPDPAEKRATRPGTRLRPKKKGPANKDDNTEAAVTETESTKTEVAKPADAAAKEDEVKDSWDAIDEDSAPEEADTSPDRDESETVEDDEDDEVSESESESEEDSDSEKEDANFNPNDPEDRRLRAERRIIQRQAEFEKQRTTDNLRAAVVCVLGHVDTGKTKILDKLRRTHVQDSEAGGITQQIGATNVPIDAIKEQAKVVREATDFEYKLPGLLIIDTPGHESFSNLRNRGSSLCDIAILVVDIMHGLEPQTLESISLLKKKKCPFIVALNKIDRLYDWKVMARRDVRDVLKEQQPNTQLEFQTRAKDVILQFAEQGLNTALFYENPDPKTYISLVPTSAITGEGMGNLLFLIIEFCQRMLPKRLMYSDELQATVLEVKAIPGLGTTIDTILINGRLREGQTMILAGTDGPIVTQIRSLLMPQPMKELRVKNAYEEHKEVKAAQGVKIAAKDLEKAIAGINLLIAHKPDEVEICKEEVAKELKSALSHIKLAQTGVYVQASTLGSLEALLEFLRTSKIPYAAIRIGPVVKRDVMKASTMLEHEAQYATILAFDVKVEREAQEMADSLGVKIFQADIIYHLFDKFTAYREELKQKKREEFKSIAVFPCKLKILPHFIFNSRDPIVMGVIVENGIVKVGTPICVPSKEFVDIGIVTSIESNHKQIESARKGQEICIKIEPIPGESPKMYGRHFEADDMLVSKISRQSIDACKDYFRDDLIKADWSLMVELKKLFEIL